MLPEADLQDGVGACVRYEGVECDGFNRVVVAESVPGAPIGELCGDGVDNDCDGVVDEAPLANLQEGVCEGMLKVCGAPNLLKQYIYDLLPQSETDIFSAYKVVEWRFLKLLSHLEREYVDLQNIGSGNWEIIEQK
mgnify:CR=1 FL=1